MVDGSARIFLWNSMATCAREGLGTSSEDGAFITTCESMVGRSISWDAIVVDGDSGWIRNNPSKTKVDTLSVGGDFSSIGSEVSKTNFFVVANY